MISYFRDSRLSRAIRTTIKSIVGFNTMPDDPAAAVIADRRELMDRTFKTVERVTSSARHNFE
jgi:hypothetical protein